MLVRAALVLLAGGPLGAQDETGAAGVDAARAQVDFVRDIQPILREHCYACHGPEKKRGALRLDSREWAMRGGVSGKIVVPGQAKASSLYLLLVDPDPDARMPQKADPLPRPLAERLRLWIDQGAPWPDVAAGEAAVEKHWAYVKPVAAKIPDGRHPVDALLAVEREKLGLAPRPEASREVLVRRAYLDLVGLPPTPEEIDAYDGDWAKLVDRLLADPRHGERWGRHWLDIWRYSDWAGFKDQVRESRPHLWRWRDWVVESLNADKPYDRMVVEMLAGDEVAPDDPDVLRATGFLARNWMKSSRDTWLMNTVEHTGKAFLAATLNCARCHNHFFDPISQKEYYQFRAFFEPHHVREDAVPGQGDTLARAFDKDPAAATWLYVRGDEKSPDRDHPIVPATPRAFGGPPLDIKPLTLPLSAIVPERREFVRRDLLDAAARAAADARAALEKKALAAAKDLPAAVLDALIAEARHEALASTLEIERLEDDGQKPDRGAAAERQKRVSVLEAKKAVVAADPKQRSEAEKKLEAVEKKPAAFTPRKTETYPSTSTGRRLALARWIAHPDNPLAARVVVNHVWMRHFGKPLVPSVFDFGQHGRRPSNPALLDTLAVRFMQEGWSLKKLHRLILTSAAYRMDSTPDAGSLKKDPENVHLWRMNPRRMEAEVVRDSLLHVAGLLDFRRGGPDIDASQGLTVHRRSLYFRHAAEKSMPFLELFDGPGVVECYERTESIVPQQALALANSALAQEVSRRVAGQLPTSDFVKAAYRRVLGRGPLPAETAECAAFLESQTRLLSDPSKLTRFSGPAGKASSDPAQRARESLVHVLLNHHDFITVR